jgi:hypothetical protein
MFIGSSPKQRRYLSPITRLRPAVGVNIAAKDATNEIDLTKHFVAREGSQRERASAKRIFQKNYLNGVIPPAQCAKPSKKGPPQRRQGEYVVERIIPRTAP